MKTMHEQTLQWAKDRKIVPNGKVTTQALKLGSEFGELCGHLANNEPIKDDIGDCLVVCTILEALSGRNLLETMTTPIQKHTTPLVPQAMKYLGDIQDATIKNQDFQESLANFLHQLEGIALTRNTSFLECWEMAYSDIKDRKGILTAEGNFIKSTDIMYEQAVIEDRLGFSIGSGGTLSKGDSILEVDKLLLKDITQYLDSGYTPIPF